MPAYVLTSTIFPSHELTSCAQLQTSTVLATGVIIRALYRRTNFYSACVYLAQSNACLMVNSPMAILEEQTIY